MRDKSDKEIIDLLAEYGIKHGPIVGKKNVLMKGVGAGLITTSTSSGSSSCIYKSEIWDHESFHFWVNCSVKITSRDQEK